MATSNPHTDSVPVHPDIRFEETDVSMPGVIATGVGILVVTWFCAFVLYFLYVTLVGYWSAAGTAPPVRAEHRQVVPPEPRLEASPPRDLALFRESEEAALHSYRWVDQQHGIVSIPIERAIELLAQRGIPPQRAPAGANLPIPIAGTRVTGFEGKVEPEPR